MASKPPETQPLQTISTTSLVWLAVWVALALWAVHALATTWPYMNLPPQLVLTIALPGLMLVLLGMVARRGLATPLRGWRLWLARLGVLVAALFANGLLWDATDKLSMARFENMMAPLISQLHAQPATACDTATRFTQSAPFKEYLDDSKAPRKHMQLHFNSRQFVLAAMGGSIDIDGSTIYYDSNLRKWDKFHNDDRTREKALENRVVGLEECKLALR